jgi:prolyl-tRNA editing enzyme YbaK/EbsC (Cys-tRNA(Pro) deacylase)
MNLQRELRSQLRQHLSPSVPIEQTCTCGGAPDHVRILLFRVNGQPATAIVPETAKLTPRQLAEVLAGARVESLPVAELGSIFLESELGHAGPFDNPFGDSIYLDESLLQFDNLVFCPKMFSGKMGQCFRVPTSELCEAIHPTVLRLIPPLQLLSERQG